MNKYILCGVLALGLISPILTQAQVQGDTDPNGSQSACVTLQYNLTVGSRDSSTGGDVSELQDFLQNKGYLGINPTGYFGQMTRAAVMRYQSASGILNSGYVGPITRERTQSISCSDDSVELPPLTTISTAACAGGALFNSVTGKRCVPAEPIVCTTDVKLCSDGSYVSRGGPSCAFGACPSTVPGCAPGALYSSTTSFRCDGSTLENPVYLPGCSSYDGFSSVNGNACDGSTPASQPPAITSISPTSAPFGSTLTISGTGFTSTGNSVYAGTLLLASQLTSNGTILSFVLPQFPGPGAYATTDISVQNASGISNSVMFTPTISSAGTLSACNLDVDGNGNKDALTDGLLIMRYQSGSRGTALTTGALGTGATRSASTIESFIAARNYDVDGNGSMSASTDGLMIQRYLFGLSGSSITSGAIGAGATRSTDQIVTWLNACAPVTQVATPTITVTSPNGGESWKIGETHSIQWVNQGVAATSYPVQIGIIDTRYNTESGTRAEAIIANSIANSGSYSWTIPQSVGTMDLRDTSQSVYKIVVHSWSDAVTGLAAGDSSDSPFTITSIAATPPPATPTISIIQPNDGTSLARGNSYNIQWIASNFPAKSTVYLELRSLSNSYIPPTKLALMLPTPGEYRWAIPSNWTLGQYTLKVYKADQNGVVSSGEVATDSVDFSVVADPAAATTAACSFSGQTVAHGSSVTAYQASTVSYGSDCVSEQRSCNNGVLSGSYTKTSCSVSPAPSTIACNLDVDGSGTRLAGIDGVLISRYLSGSRGTELTNYVPFPSNATRTASGDIETFLSAQVAARNLDADGNGTQDAYDGNIIKAFVNPAILRTNIINSGVGAGATRTDGPTIDAWLSAKCGGNSVSQAGSASGSVAGATNFSYTWNTDLQVGSTGSDVVALQSALTSEGVYSGEITGGFYSQTFSAVQAFQAKYGIDATGYVGPATRAKLNALY